jgi:predicted Zn-dependent protease
MKANSIKILFVLTAMIFASVALGYGTNLDQRKPQKITEPARLGNLTERLYKRISKAQLLLADQKFEDALLLLSRLEISTKNNPFGLAQVYQTEGFLYAQQSKYKMAQKALQKSLKLKALPLRGTLNSMMTLAQIYMADENFQKAIPLIQDVIFNSENVKPRRYVTLAQCYTALKMHRAAIFPLRKAIQIESSPKETWYQLLVALHYELKEYKDASDALTFLVKMRPDKKKYWKQLSSLYLAQNRDRDAVATMEIAYKKGFLTTEKDVKRLVSLLYHGGIPWKAAKFLEKALNQGIVAKTRKNYEMLSNFWSESEEVEKALASLNLAAPLAKDGRIYVKQGSLFLALENWPKARTSFEAGLKKGKLKKPGFAYLSLGISRYKLKDFAGATSSFLQAKKISYTKGQAEQWLAHMHAEGH